MQPPLDYNLQTDYRSAGLGAAEKVIRVSKTGIVASIRPRRVVRNRSPRTMAEYENCNLVFSKPSFQTHIQIVTYLKAIAFVNFRVSTVVVLRNTNRSSLLLQFVFSRR